MRRPEFIARQGGMPSGLLGRFVASVMQRETKCINARVTDLLAVRPGERVLDVGTGNGLTLGRLAAQAGDGLVVGVDHSAVMCRRATGNNQALISEGRVRVECAQSDDLPFESGSFDAALSVHTLYFWDPVEPHLREIAKVLRPGGRMVLAFRPDSDPATSEFPDSVYTFRSLETVKELLSDCGFRDIRCSAGDDAVALVRATRA